MDDNDLSRRIGIGLLATLVVVSGLWFIAVGERRTTVTLKVDNSERRIETAAGTVGALLEEQKVSVRSQDLIKPPTTAPVVDGLFVTVQTSRAVMFNVDGREFSRRTIAPTVGDALTSFGIAAPTGSILAPPRTSPVTDGLRISVRRPAKVRVRFDGEEAVAVTTAPTIAKLLADEMRVRFDRDADVVEPGLGALPLDGHVVTVSRPGTHEYTTHETVPPPVQVRYDPDLALGQQVVIAAGSDGVIDRIYRTVVKNGAIARRQVVKEIVLNAPTPKIIAIGTRTQAGTSAAGPPTTVPAPTTTAADVPVTTVPPARAAPPSSVPPASIALPSTAAPAPPASAASDAGEPRAESGVASWYARAGQVAAHQWLPLGTVVKVTNAVSGAFVFVTIDDRGPYGPGRIIDLSDGAFSQLASLEDGLFSAHIEW